MENCLNNYSDYETNTILYNSYVFHTRVQYHEETFIDFLNAVIELAKYCDFEARNRMIRDQIIVGMKDSSLRSELFKLGNPTLDDLLEYLKSVEIQSDSYHNNESFVRFEQGDKGKSNEETENVELGSCESNEVSGYVKNEPMDFDVALQDKNEDYEEPTLSSEAEFNDFDDKPEDILKDSPDSPDPPDPPETINYINSTSGTLHSYIIKKEAFDNVSNENEGITTDSRNPDLSSASSGDGDNHSDESRTSNQRVPEGSTNEKDGGNSDNDIIEILSDVQVKKNYSNSEVGDGNLKTDSAINTARPKRKNNKIVDVIEIDDSDEEDFNRNSRTEKVKEPRESVIVKQEPTESILYNILSSNSNQDDNNYDKQFQDQTQVKVEKEETSGSVSQNENSEEFSGSSNDSLEKSYHCAECNMNFSSEHILETHVLIHESSKRYECNKCLKTFFRLCNLNTHKSVFHGDDEIFKYTESFSEQTDLDSHLTERTEEAESDYSKLNETDREENNSSDSIIYSNKIIYSERNHDKKYNESLKEGFSCCYCNKILHNRSRLHRHLSKHHSGMKPFECEECFQTFSLAQTLKVHMLIHSGEKPYKCDMCTKSFRQKSNLDVHLNRHSGDKPYKCNECTKSFRQKSNLDVHLTKHSGERPVQCNECLKSFLCKAHLINHMKIHTKKISFLCPQCNKLFSSRSSLKRHSYLHTNERPHYCDICAKGFLYPGLLKKHKQKCRRPKSLI